VLHGLMAGYARDVADALAQLGVSRYALLGHSLGGAMAAALAERSPEAVSALMLLAPVGFGRTREALRAIVESGRSPEAFHHGELAYTGPVQVVWGERDRLVPPSHRHGVRRVLPHAQIDVWTGMGHHPLCERPDELFAAIRLMLAASTADAAAGGDRPPGALTAAA
jgi:pimeloyl-ACP methyl ester carboxylesterase